MGGRLGGVPLKQGYGKVYSRDYIHDAIVVGLSLLGLLGLGVALVLLDDMAQAVTA